MKKQIKCYECNEFIGLLKVYRHPVFGKRVNVCGKCLNKLNKNIDKYRNFIFRNVKKEGIGTICFILIKTFPKYEHKVCNRLSTVPEVLETHPLLGGYDLITKIGVKDYKSLGNFITNKIRNIEGIKDTKTLTGAFTLTGNTE